MQEPPASLVARCRCGDTQAFAQLVGMVQAFVYNLAYRLLCDEEEARDLAQEALLRVWRTLPSFRGEARFTTWLYRLVVNMGLNRRAWLRRRPSATDVDCTRLADPAGLAEDPQEIHRAHELRRLIWQQVGSLPDKYRLVLALYYQHGRSYQEIGEILQLPVNTVKTHMARARRMLADRLTNDEGIKDEL